MREIKFRAWMRCDDITGEGIIIERKEYRMVKWKEMAEQGWSIGNLEDDGQNKCFRPSIFMQFTGLKDKYGKEIYEGDILNITKEPKEINMVEYSGSRYILNPHGLSLQCWCKQSEIIGNIYMNPGLIK